MRLEGGQNDTEPLSAGAPCRLLAAPAVWGAAMLMATGFGRGKEAPYQATRSVLWDLSPVTLGTWTYFYMSRFKLCLPWLGLTQAFALVSIPRPRVSCQEAANAVRQKYINILLKSSFLWNSVKLPTTRILRRLSRVLLYLLGWGSQTLHYRFFF